MAIPYHEVILLMRETLVLLRRKTLQGPWSVFSLVVCAFSVSAAEISPAPGAPAERPVTIQEYRVLGAHHLPKIEVEGAVYPYLGPGRTSVDVEQARAALEKAYKDKGYQTVTVEIPPQQVRRGVVQLQVNEGKVGRLRVTGSRYYSIDHIKEQARSVAEGKLINFNDVNRDIVALNQLADRRVTPILRAGVDPGTVDIDLNVKDTLPLHGSVELNNRYSADTTELRLNGSLSYANLWQQGHTLGLSFQVAPQRIEDAKVFSAFYLARVPGVDWLSLMLQGTKQDSNVSTLGGASSAGRGEVVGARAIIALPTLKDFYHSLTFGLDYKHFDQGLVVAGVETVTPITYYPLSAVYSGSWLGKGSVTELNAGVYFHFRGTGSADTEFDNKRFNADGSFIYFRGDLSHTHELPVGLQAFAKVQGQASGQPLLDSEQFSGGGLDTARGYLESQALGDNAIFGSLELRSPSLSRWVGEKVVNECRVYAFVDAGVLTLKDPLPEQDSRFELASVGVGSRLRMWQHFNGSLDFAFPLIAQTPGDDRDPLLTFRLWADF